MFDVGWTEMLVIGIVALIVVGPKDLPILFRRMGEFTGKARAMAREFTSAMDKAADEAGVKDIQSDLRKMANPKQTGLDALDDITKDFRDLEKDMGNLDGEMTDTAPAKSAKGPQTQKLADDRAEAAAKARASVYPLPGMEDAPSDASASETPPSGEKPA